MKKKLHNTAVQIFLETRCLFYVMIVRAQTSGKGNFIKKSQAVVPDFYSSLGFNYFADNLFRIVLTNSAETPKYDAM